MGGQTEVCVDAECTYHCNVYGFVAQSRSRAIVHGDIWVGLRNASMSGSLGPIRTGLCFGLGRNEIQSQGVDGTRYGTIPSV